MVLMFRIKNNFILLEAFASVFTVSTYFTDNPRINDCKKQGVDTIVNNHLYALYVIQFDGGAAYIRI